MARERDAQGRCPSSIHPLPRYRGAAVTYYNEFDPFAAGWLRNLISAGHIAQGVVDERSIHEVQPGDIPARAHFFAGIGGWDLALQLAGWPADWPVWTGSCPCQPYSVAGRRRGDADERNLWPVFRGLIAANRPSTIFGEQVASADGRLWLDGVRADLEALGYEVGAADLCAAGVSAPHIRQRLYWVANAKSERFHGRRDTSWTPGRDGSEDSSLDSGLGHACGQGLSVSESKNLRGAGRREEGRAASESSRAILGMEYAKGDGREQWRPESSQWGTTGRRGADGKWRRIKPGIEPLAHGVPARVGKLRGYGNAIVPQVAAEFIAAFMESLLSLYQEAAP